MDLNTIDKTYALTGNQGDSRIAEKRFIILHESGNDSDRKNERAVKNEAYYMHDNFGNAYTTHFVGTYDGKEKIYQIGEPGYVSWGALNANPYAPVQIEFARSTSPETFKIAYRAYINLARYYAKLYGIPLTLDQGGVNTPGIKTHSWVTKNFGGDHVDPYPYFTEMGITKEQLAKDLLNGVDGQVAREETVNNIVKVTDNRFKAFATYDKKGNPNVGTDITPNSEWVSNSIVALTNENLPFYQIATNIFIPQKITNFKDVVVINLPKSEHAYTVNDLGEKTGDKVDNSLIGGSLWQHDGTLYPMKNGVIAYKIASNLYLPVQFAQGSGYTGI